MIAATIADIDIVLAERLFVLFETQAVKPGCDVHSLPRRVVSLTLTNNPGPRNNNFANYGIALQRQVLSNLALGVEVFGQGPATMMAGGHRWPSSPGAGAKWPPRR